MRARRAERLAAAAAAAAGGSAQTRPAAAAAPAPAPAPAAVSAPVALVPTASVVSRAPAPASSRAPAPAPVPARAPAVAPPAPVPAPRPAPAQRSAPPAAADPAALPPAPWFSWSAASPPAPAPAPAQPWAAGGRTGAPRGGDRPPDEARIEMIGGPLPRTAWGPGRRLDGEPVDEAADAALAATLQQEEMLYAQARQRPGQAAEVRRPVAGTLGTLATGHGAPAPPPPLAPRCRTTTCPRWSTPSGAASLPATSTTSQRWRSSACPAAPAASRPCAAQIGGRRTPVSARRSSCGSRSCRWAA